MHTSLESRKDIVDRVADEDLGGGLEEYFSSRNDGGELTHLFDPPSPFAWKGLHLFQP